MGEKTDTSYDVFGIDNPLFPPGKTPNMVKVHVTGITRGVYFDPLTNAVPPNHIFHCYQISQQTWTGYRNAFLTDGTKLPYRWMCRITEPGVTANRLWIECDTSVAMWDNIWPGANYWSYDARQTEPENDYYGGTAQAFWIPPTPDIESIAETMRLVGVSRGNKVFFEPMTDESKAHIHRIADRKDATCINIKMSH